MFNYLVIVTNKWINTYKALRTVPGREEEHSAELVAMYFEHLPC